MIKTIRFFSLLIGLIFSFSVSGQTEIEVNEAVFGNSNLDTAYTRLLGPGVDMVVEYEDHIEYGVVE